MRLLRAILFVSDMDAMTAFYRDGLGLAVVSSQPGWTELDAGGAVLALHAIPAPIAARLVPGPREDTPIKLCFAAPDLDGARAELARRGATMREPTGWGTCDGLDPEGNVFQLVRAP